MKKVVICARNYPNPGGRISLLFNLLENMPDIKVISYGNIKGFLKNFRYNIKCFFQLIRLNPDIVVGMGTASEYSMLYARLFRKKGIYNTSGFRFIGYNFSPNVISELLSMNFCHIIAVPSDEVKERIIENMNHFRKKIKIIYEGTKPIKEKNHIGFNVGITRVDPPDFERIYGGIQERCAEFKDATIFLIKRNIIEYLKKGKPINYRTKRFKEALPYMDLLFIVPCDKYDFHSSTLLEALEAKVPFFITDLCFLSKEIRKTRFYLENSEIGTIINKYKDFRKNEDSYRQEFEEFRKSILKKYKYEKTMNEWKALLD